MVTNKYITKIISALMALAVILCLATSAFSKQLQAVYGNNAVTMEYETELFDTDQVMDIDILMDEDDWNDMLENAISEEYYSCDVVVNGKKFYSVGIRPKGNTSLSSIASDPDTDRYSFKLEFDHYIKGQTCYGLDKLILNNNYADATNMKEAVEDSFMLRNYGTEDGNLYKPESMGVGGGDGEEGKDGGEFPGIDAEKVGEDSQESDGEKTGEDSQNSNRKENEESGTDNGETAESEKESPSASSESQMPQGGGFQGGAPQMGNPPENIQMPQSENDKMPDEFQFSQNGEQSEDIDFSDFKMGAIGGSGGADLNYTDDDLDSYSTIWDGEVTSSGKKDHKRVVEALKNISEGTDLETYMDVDNILKYMAVHTFVVNDDSLSGTMAHNYYLYEYNGKLNILPWDYNLSFGGMSMGGGMGGQSSGATSVINDAIDTPFSITNFFDALLENEEYLAKYHEYLNELVEKYVNGGEFQKTYERIRSQIDELVAEDPTAFYSYEEYEAAVEMLYEVINLRGESVSGQLDGTIPSTDDGQKADSSTLIDGSGIELSVMGSMSMGGGAGEGIGVPGGRGDGGQMRAPGGSVDEQQTGVPGGSVDKQQTGTSSGGSDGQQMRAPGGSIDEQQTGASGKEAGNSDGNEALQKTESGGV